MCLKVLGLEQYGVAHSMGSSHGISRIIRLAYHEDPAYVPLLKRAYQLWKELEEETKQVALHVKPNYHAPIQALVSWSKPKSCVMHMPYNVNLTSKASHRLRI